MSSVPIRVRWALLLIGVWALSACGGGSSGGMSSVNPPAGSMSGAQSCSNCGTAMVSLTDAPGDFISYMVTVVSLQLKRSDGTVVETLPVTTKVDFAKLVNLSEIVSAHQIPAGSYVSASITLDFASSTIVVDNGTAGVTIAAGSVINGATSLPLAAPNPTQITLNLKLGSDDELIVTPHAISNLALDFNLSASNTIAPSNTNPVTVTVNPVLTASLVPDATKQFRVRGPFVSADTGANTFIIGVDSDETEGQLTVNTTGTTTYSINNMSFTGGAGLMQLAGLAAHTMVVAYGSWDKATGNFTASNVLAGSSVPGIMHDGVEGTVLSRSGNTLVVANGEVHHMQTDIMTTEDDMEFERQVTVTLGAATMVSEDGQSGTFSIQDISVGQHLQLSGTLGKDGSGNTTLDATAGSARLMPTTLFGLVTSVAANLVTVNLGSIGGQAPSRLNFAGTGTSTAMDASATAYTVGVPTALATTTLSSGSPVRFEGFVAPFGKAPPDFNAATLVSFAETRALLDLEWASPGITAPFATLSSTQLLINQATLKSSEEHRILIGPSVLDPSTLSTGLQLVPDPSATSPWLGIVHMKSLSSENFSTFGNFVTALTTVLNGTNTAVRIDADGHYDASTGVLSVDQMIVLIND